MTCLFGRASPRFVRQIENGFDLPYEFPNRPNASPLSRIVVTHPSESFSILSIALTTDRIGREERNWIGYTIALGGMRLAEVQ